MTHIRTEPAPNCPECGAGPMKLRKPKPGDDWPAFWGCRDWPACPGKRGILPDGTPSMDEWEAQDFGDVVIDDE